MYPRLVFKLMPKPFDWLDRTNAVDWSNASGANLKTSFSKFYLMLTLGDYFIELIRHFICIQKLAEERFKSSKKKILFKLMLSLELFQPIKSEHHFEMTFEKI